MLLGVRIVSELRSLVSSSVLLSNRTSICSGHGMILQSRETASKGTRLALSSMVISTRSASRRQFLSTGTLSSPDSPLQLKPPRRREQIELVAEEVQEDGYDGPLPYRPFSNLPRQQQGTNIVTRWNKYPDGSRFWKPIAGTGRYQRPIFVAATRQHVGKTTVSLAIMSGLIKRHGGKVGFIKPVGQQHVEVPAKGGPEAGVLRVDKDVCLVREYFKLQHIDYEYMSPVIIPQGYTKKYVDGEISLQEQVRAVEQSMAHVTAKSEIVLCEGTGHCAVGSIVGLNNARVASLMGADMVLVANGGLGSAFDDLELNRILCQHYHVRIAGVVINKVIPDKLEQTAHYMRKAMMQAWGIPLLGCIPDRPFLGCPALADLEGLFRTKLIAGEEHRFRHYNTNDINVVTTSLTRFLENLRIKPTRTLYICHVTRDDLIVGFMGEYQRRKESKTEGAFEAALIVCGRKGKYQLSQEVTDMLHGLSGAPVMVVELSTHDTMTKIHGFTPKLNIHDTNRVQVAVDHYEPYLDFDTLLHRTQSSNSSFNEPGTISLEELRRL